MVHASVRGWRAGRGLVVAAAVLLLGAAVVALVPSDPAGAAPSATKDGLKDSPEKKGGAVPSLAPFKHTLHAKVANDVPEMVKTINEKVEAEWAKNKVVPSHWADDCEFIRRASLDIIGRIAKPEEIREFLKDPAETRRSLLIERLLTSEEYPRHWANMWTNWMLTRSGIFGRGTYHDETALWLEDQFAQNKPYHEIVRGVLTAEGENTKNGAVNFILAHVGENVPGKDRAELGQFEMVPITSRITRLFLGIQVQCSQCHDHPFQSSIKQQHFWGINAFLRQVERKGNLAMRRQDTPGPLTLVDNESACADATVYFEKRNGVIQTQRAEFLPSGEEKGKRLDPSKKGVQRREELAAFLIEHEQFPKAIVNRMWGVFFGRGFINPIDDFNDNNQPSNPELLNELAARFKHYNYDLKKLIRWICNSKPYHLSHVANKTNDKQEQEVLFSRMVLKAMSPEQLFESLMVATRSEVAENKDAKKDARNAWLGSLISNFGDDEGNEVNFNGTVVQALMMMNGKEINEAISRKEKGTVHMAIAQARTAAAVVNELYLAALNRPPTPREMSLIFGQFRLRNPQIDLKDQKDPAARFEDLFWALLNSNEFLLNH
jgi:hypothetical protein